MSVCLCVDRVLRGAGSGLRPAVVPEQRAADRALRHRGLPAPAGAHVTPCGSRAASRRHAPLHRRTRTRHACTSTPARRHEHEYTNQNTRTVCTSQSARAHLHEPECRGVAEAASGDCSQRAHWWRVNECAKLDCTALLTWRHRYMCVCMYACVFVWRCYRTCASRHLDIVIKTKIEFLFAALSSLSAPPLPFSLKSWFVMRQSARML